MKYVSCSVSIPGSAQGGVAQAPLAGTVCVNVKTISPHVGFTKPSNFQIVPDPSDQNE